MNNYKIVNVFTWNKPFEHYKLKELPIGLNKNRQFDIIQNWLENNDIVNYNKQKLLCINCSLSTSNERVILNNLVKNNWNSFCDILPFTSPISSNYIPSFIEGKIRIDKTNPKCYDDWKPYKFILSPRGAGIDCHRTWEAIICNIIPIVKKSNIDELFSDLPVLIVNKWEDINEEMLISNYEVIYKKRQNNEYNMNKIKLEYWINKIQESINIKSKKHFVTYGDKKYEKSKNKLLEEVKDSNIFDIIKGYSPEDLPESFAKKYSHILSQSRGGGYLLWKPMILYNHLKTLDYGDYLVYLDAGCSFNKYGMKRFYEYIEMLNNSNYGILSFCMHNQIEKWWTTREIFEYFQIDNNGEHANSGQFLGGVFIIKKNIHSEEYVKKLVSITLTQPELYTDIFNNNGKQNEWFKDNRHDQSISSILRKIHGTFIIPTDESFKIPFNKGESLQYPFWAMRRKC